MSRFVITGAGGGSPNRLEIYDFVKNEKFFSLYIQALQAMQTKQSQSDLQSFFQVGGIHGLPYVVWDGATGDEPVDPDTQWAGYCTHGSVLFPTWHRPYVMLYEQILQQQAEEIAATYTVNKEDWKQAARNLRQPFWDWARKSTPPDEVIAFTQVTITGRDGKHVKVDNPLYHYKFHPVDPSFSNPYSNWPTTLRQPRSTGPNATDDVSRLKRVLANSQNNIMTNTYNMLTRVNTWPAFSNHTRGDGGSTSNSLEAIHDNIHGLVGGGGHMANPAVAAMDPIFYLHHANVDRLLSLWSALHPGVWVSAGDAEDGTFTIPAGVPVDRNTPLTPFWNDQTTFWASTAVGDTTKLGYSYPEFNGLDMGNTNAVMTAIAGSVNRLYGSPVFGSSFAAVPSTFLSLPPVNNAPEIPTVTPQKRVLSDVPPTSSSLSSVEKAPEASPSHNSVASQQQHAPSTQLTDHSQKHLDIHVQQSPARPIVHGGQSYASPNHGLWEWTARIEFKKCELRTSFSVPVFLGSAPEDPDEWHVCANYVGSVHAFVNSAAERCANCLDKADIIQEGFVHLNDAIAQHSGLGSLEPEVVEPYLIDALHWRVQKSDGTVAELESLEVTIFATELTYPPGAMFPVPGEARRHNRITYGRTGGSRHA